MGLYIAEGIAIIALVGIVYLMVRTYPMVREEKNAQQVEKRLAISSDTIYAWDKKILTFLEKGLRKSRVAILKVDHAVSQKLDTVKKKSEAHEKSSAGIFAELEKKIDEEKTDEEDNVVK